MACMDHHHYWCNTMEIYLEYLKVNLVLSEEEEFTNFKMESLEKSDIEEDYGDVLDSLVTRLPNIAAVYLLIVMMRKIWKSLKELIKI